MLEILKPKVWAHSTSIIISPFSTLTFFLLLQGHLWLHWLHLDNPGYFPHLSVPNRTLYIGHLIRNRHLFLIVPGMRESKLKALGDVVSREGHVPVASLSPHRWKLSAVFFIIKALSPLVRAPLSNLITSQRPHLLKPMEIRLQHEFWRDTFSPYLYLPIYHPHLLFLVFKIWLCTMPVQNTGWV